MRNFPTRILQTKSGDYSFLKADAPMIAGLACTRANSVFSFCLPPRLVEQSYPCINCSGAAMLARELEAPTK